MTGEEEKWAEKSEWTRGGRKSGSGLQRRRAGAAPLPRGTPPARLSGPPAPEAEPLIRPSPPFPICAPLPAVFQSAPLLHSGSLLAVYMPPPEFFLPPGSSIYFLHVLTSPHSVLHSPPPAFYLRRPRSKLCLCCLTPPPPCPRPPPLFLTKSWNSNPSFSNPTPPRFHRPPTILSKGLKRKWGATAAAAVAGEGRGGGGGQWSGKQDK